MAASVGGTMNVRLSVLLVVVLAFIGGFIYFSQFGRASKPLEDRPLFYRVNPDDIVHISIRHEDKQVAFKKVDTAKWVFDNPEETPVNPDRFSGTTYLLSGPRAERLSAENVEDPSIYGLEPPKSVVEVTLRDGRTFRFHFGDKNPAGDLIYARFDDDPRVFLITSSWSDVLIRLATEPPTPTPEPEATP